MEQVAVCELRMLWLLLYLPTFTPYAWVSCRQIKHIDLMHAGNFFMPAFKSGLLLHQTQQHKIYSVSFQKNSLVKWHFKVCRALLSLSVCSMSLATLGSCHNSFRNSQQCLEICRKSSATFGNSRDCFENPGNMQMKISCIWLRKSWQLSEMEWWTETTGSILGKYAHDSWDKKFFTCIWHRCRDAKSQWFGSRPNWENQVMNKKSVSPYANSSTCTCMPILSAQVYYRS